MQLEKSILDRIQRRQLNLYGHLLRIEDSQCRGHRTQGEEEEDRNNHGRIK